MGIFDWLRTKRSSDTTRPRSSSCADPTFAFLAGLQNGTTQIPSAKPSQPPPAQDADPLAQPNIAAFVAVFTNTLHWFDTYLLDVPGGPQARSRAVASNPAFSKHVFTLFHQIRTENPNAAFEKQGDYFIGGQYIPMWLFLRKLADTIVQITGETQWSHQVTVPATSYKEVAAGQPFTGSGSLNLAAQPAKLVLNRIDSAKPSASKQTPAQPVSSVLTKPARSEAEQATLERRLKAFEDDLRVREQQMARHEREALRTAFKRMCVRLDMNTEIPVDFEKMLRDELSNVFLSYPLQYLQALPTVLQALQDRNATAHITSNSITYGIVAANKCSIDQHLRGVAQIMGATNAEAVAGAVIEEAMGRLFLEELKRSLPKRTTQSEKARTLENMQPYVHFYNAIILGRKGFFNAPQLLRELKETLVIDHSFLDRQFEDMIELVGRMLKE